MKIISIFSIILLLSLAICTVCTAQSGRYPIIPYPSLLQPADREFIITDQTSIYLENGAAFKDEAWLLQQMLAQAGKKVSIHTHGTQQHVIVLTSDPSLKDDEAYSIKITATE